MLLSGAALYDEGVGLLFRVWRALAVRGDACVR